MNIEKILLKHGVNLIKEKVIYTSNKTTASIRNSLNKEVGNIINSAKNMPHDLYNESIHNFHTEEIGTTFQHNSNSNDFDYFNNFYSHYDKRCTPTPTNNLAEQMWKYEQNSKINFN